VDGELPFERGQDVTADRGFPSSVVDEHGPEYQGVLVELDGAGRTGVDGLRFCRRGGQFLGYLFDLRPGRRLLALPRPTPLAH